jgi:hypothetical protein
MGLVLLKDQNEIIILVQLFHSSPTRQVKGGMRSPIYIVL